MLRRDQIKTLDCRVSRVEGFRCAVTRCAVTLTAATRFVMVRNAVILIAAIHFVMVRNAVILIAVILIAVFPNVMVQNEVAIAALNVAQTVEAQTSVPNAATLIVADQVAVILILSRNVGQVSIHVVIRVVRISSPFAGRNEVERA